MRNAIFGGLVLIGGFAGAIAATDFSTMPGNMGVLKTAIVTYMGNHDADTRCLALNLYHEARGEDYKGIVAVAHVVLNRVNSKHYPNEICDVIFQARKSRHTNKILRNKCQFSWFCDGKNDKPRDQEAWSKMKEIAAYVLVNQRRDPTRGALLYHANYVKPYWAKKRTATAKIGQHLFYRKL